MRERRRAIPPADQESAARRVADTALALTDFPLGGHVALYRDADGELGTGFLLEGLLAKDVCCYLPVLLPDKTLAFRRYQGETGLQTNFFGLLEPGPDSPAIAPADLTTVFLPLVAFDASGNRLGMGGGYYDRTFAFTRQTGAHGPRLVGLAHECQRVGKLEAADWDVPLGGIITDRHYYRAS